MDIAAAETDLPCRDVQETAAFFRDELGFRLHTIYPAEDPAVAVIAGHGLRLRLVRGLDAPPGVVRLLGAETRPPITAPNGTRVEFAEIDPWPEVPANRPSLTYTPPPDGDAGWGTGRAGMQYRDLIPDRWGGRFIASHIRIPNGGPVPDYVHFHKVRFQMIFCAAGWVRLVYEDQGEPFVMKAGECVLQPPEIRHRVLEASDGLEVVEIGCPAEHPTHLDHVLPLPTDTQRPERVFNGQRFVFHSLDDAVWDAWTLSGARARDLGIRAATDGLATVRVVEAQAAIAGKLTPAEEFHLLFALSGSATIAGFPLSRGASIALPPGLPVEVSAEPGFETLEVML